MKNIRIEKDPSETPTIEFDFSQKLKNVSSVVMTCTTVIGTDTSNLLAGNTPILFEGIVKQKISGGVDNNSYKIKCVATGAEGTFVLTCEQPVRAL